MSGTSPMHSLPSWLAAPACLPPYAHVPRYQGFVHSSIFFLSPLCGRVSLGALPFFYPPSILFSQTRLDSNLAMMVESMKTGAVNGVPVVFVLDEFERFTCRKPQTLLYALLDLCQVRLTFFFVC